MTEITITNGPSSSFGRVMDIVGDKGIAALLAPLVDAADIQDSEIKFLAANKDVLLCLRELGSGRLQRGGEGLKEAPPLRLLATLAAHGSRRMAEHLMTKCSVHASVQFACDLLANPGDLEDLPQEAIDACVSRARDALVSLEDLIPRDVANRFRELDGYGKDATHAFHPYFARQDLKDAKSELLRLKEELGFAAQMQSRPTLSQENRLSALCTTFAVDELHLLRDALDLAAKYGIPISPSPSTGAFWQAIAKDPRQGLFFAEQAMRVVQGVHVDRLAMAPLLRLFPSARPIWIKALRAAALQSMQKADSGATRRDGFAIRRERQENKDRIRTNFWAAVHSPDVSDKCTQWLAASRVGPWLQFSAGQLDATLGDAETVIHELLQHNLQFPLSPEELAGLYIAAILHGVHESPLLQFPENIAAQAWQQLLALMSQSRNIGFVFYVMPHLVEFDRHTVEPTFKLPLIGLIRAFTMGKKEVWQVVSMIREISEQLPALELPLLRIFAVGREYEVISELTDLRLDELRDGDLLPFCERFGAAYPLTPEIVAQMVADRKRLGAAQDGHSVDQALDAFVAGRLHVFAQGPDDETPAMRAVREREFGALLEASEPLLSPSQYKDMKKEHANLKRQVRQEADKI